ncbi:helix-turn-helix domain-containing protein [Convivina intestini]|uniref:Cro/C1-type helix-turn-helix DNA-binding protein n=1 Tax=Convivina intestini TaxID=1505726 RepID=A0A2U1D728_9LACO|nr:helix-turn-helix transcriptional regulator [Convivina intestini]PVY83477.1 hypothetical protein C7384_10785 [Convivina intestini]SDC23409.1 hypothetical protein SAMN05216341_1267 [Leuconostocaceae bacterium R-53105]
MVAYWKIKDTENWQRLVSERGYTESSLGRLIGVTYQSMYNYRKNHAGMLPDKAKKMADLLGGKTTDFFYQ